MNVVEIELHRSQNTPEQGCLNAEDYGLCAVLGLNVITAILQAPQYLNARDERNQAEGCINEIESAGTSDSGACEQLNAKIPVSSPFDGDQRAAFGANDFNSEAQFSSFVSEGVVADIRQDAQDRMDTAANYMLIEVACLAIGGLVFRFTRRARARSANRSQLGQISFPN